MPGCSVFVNLAGVTEKLCFILSHLGFVVLNFRFVLVEGLLVFCNPILDADQLFHLFSELFRTFSHLSLRTLHSVSFPFLNDLVHFYPRCKSVHDVFTLEYPIYKLLIGDVIVQVFLEGHLVDALDVLGRLARRFIVN